MSSPSYVSDPYVQYLSALLEEISRGYLQIPRFQRKFVWTDDKRLELLRSIRDGIPIGSILLWRTNLSSPGSAIRLGPHELPRPARTQAKARQYVLDGFQRLSTLYGCLWPLPEGTSPFIPDDDGNQQSWLICYDLDSEDFKRADNEELPDEWLPLTKLLDSVRFLRFLRGLSKRRKSERLIQRADAIAETFRNYKLPIIPIATDSIEDATRTFQRINSQGTKMSELHMVRALTWNEEFDLEEQIEQAQARLATEGWESLDPELIIAAGKAALGLDISVESPDPLSKGLRNNSDMIEEVTNSLIRAAQWLRKQCSIASPRMVPYSYQLVMLAEVFRLKPHLPESSSNRLLRWFWQTTYGNYFASISGYRMKSLLDAMRDVARGEPMTWPQGKQPKLNFALPERFDARAARVKAAALRLALLDPKNETGEPIDALGQLMARGPSAMVPIIPLKSGITGVASAANRTFVSLDSELVQKLRTDIQSVSRHVLKSHLISPEAADALARGDHRLFLRARKAAIESHEAEFFTSLPER